MEGQELELVQIRAQERAERLLQGQQRVSGLVWEEVPAWAQS